MSGFKRQAIAFVVLLILVPLAAASNSNKRQDPLMEGLIHWWKFDGNANDSAGSLSTKPVGPVGYSYAPTGWGIVFNGETTGISLPDAPDMRFQGSFSIAVWAKLYRYPAPGRLWASIIFNGDDRPGLDPYDLVVSPSGYLQFLTTSSTHALAVNGTSQFRLNQFVHVAAVYDKKNGLQTLYENGLPVCQNMSVSDLTPVVPLVANQRPGIGIGTNNSFPSSIYNMGWNGVLSDLRIYNRALTASEVKDISDQARGRTNPPVIVMHDWTLNPLVARCQ